MLKLEFFVDNAENEDDTHDVDITFDVKLNGLHVGEGDIKADESFLPWLQRMKEVLERAQALISLEIKDQRAEEEKA